MTARLLGIVAVAALAACGVDRKSDGLRCTISATCTDGRVCEQGYCVKDPSCPSPCVCDPTTSPPTCTIPNGTGGDSFDCPSDTRCEITCPTTGSCGNITCSGNSSCQITCGAVASCGNLSCQNACACDVACAIGDCGAITCPRVMGTFCTASGNQGDACVSTLPNCDRC